MKKKWQLCNPDMKSVKDICNIFKCSPVTASVLINRKIDSVDCVKTFLNPSLKNLRHPFSLTDMDAAVSRIYKAITTGEKILVFGDYDVDGITATAILVDFFNYIKADILYYIPHRIKEGYGLHPGHIKNYALPNKIDLIITVDCGSSNHKAVNVAQKAGIDVIITDHHNIPLPLPAAVAVINPKRTDCDSELNHLAGVGVAFYLIISLRKYLRDKNFWYNISEPNLKDFCDLVALGTVADIVPLVDENRIFVKTGLEIMNSGCRPGIEALMQVSGIKGGDIHADDIAFKLAPRLNAAGRIEHAKTAVELLLTKDKENAAQIALSLQDMNENRKTVESIVIKEIEEYLKENPEILDLKTLILSDRFSKNGWHEGVLGIVASKLVKKYFCPVILISVKNGIGRGSGRSIPNIDIYEIILECSQILEAFGGHSMAAGITIKEDNIKQFQKKFEEIADKISSHEDFIPALTIDCVLDFDNISDDLIHELEVLEPFGAANKEPLFMAANVKISSSKIVGENHRKMLLKQTGSNKNRPYNAINFNVDTEKLCKDKFEQIAYRLKWNRWNGTKTIQLIIEET